MQIRHEVFEWGEVIRNRNYINCRQKNESQSVMFSGGFVDFQPPERIHFQTQNEQRDFKPNGVNTRFVLIALFFFLTRTV